MLISDKAATEVDEFMHERFQGYRGFRMALLSVYGASRVNLKCVESKFKIRALMLRRLGKWLCINVLHACVGTGTSQGWSFPTGYISGLCK